MPVKESCLKYKGVMSYIRRSHFSHERIVGKDIICPWKSHVSNISKSYLTYKGVMSHRNGWQGKTLFAYQGVMPHIWLWRISHDMHVDDTCSHSYVLRIFANMCIKSTKNIWQCVAMFWRVLPLVTTAGPNTSHSLIHHTATHCNTLQHTATHCNTLQHTATQPAWSIWRCAACHVSGPMHRGQSERIPHQVTKLRKPWEM